MFNWKKIIVFEWLMFLIVGVFWAAAMSLPLFLTGSLQEKASAVSNYIILWGPYAIYLVGRVLFLLFRSFMWTHLVSNYLFRTSKEKSFAEECSLVLILVVFWSLIMAYPLYLTKFFVSREKWFLGVLILLGPYLMSWAFRFLFSFFLSFGWTLKRTIKEK